MFESILKAAAAVAATVAVCYLISRFTGEPNGSGQGIYYLEYDPSTASFGLRRRH